LNALIVQLKIFFNKERECRDIHFHNMMNLHNINMKRIGRGNVKTICAFRKNWKW